MQVSVAGQEHQVYDRIYRLIFSRDGQRVAYQARTGKKRGVVIDGDEQQQFDRVGRVLFSPGGKRVAYQRPDCGRSHQQHPQQNRCSQPD